MSSSTTNTDTDRDARRAEADAAAANQRRDDTLNRIRAALLQDRLAVMELTEENTGTDPYNSGVHRALVKAHVWGKRSR